MEIFFLFSGMSRGKIFQLALVFAAHAEASNTHRKKFKWSKGAICLTVALEIQKPLDKNVLKRSKSLCCQSYELQSHFLESGLDKSTRWNNNT